jgi:hypothetical protein
MGDGDEVRARKITMKEEYKKIWYKEGRIHGQKIKTKCTRWKNEFHASRGVKRSPNQNKYRKTVLFYN